MQNWRSALQNKVEYGIAYSSDLGGDMIEPGRWIEVTAEWVYGEHISEFGPYYKRVNGGEWKLVEIA